MPQTGQLWKDEPHPVSLFVSLGQLLNDLTIDLSLSIYEANEISLGHDGPRFVRQSSNSPKNIYRSLVFQNARFSNAAMHKRRLTNKNLIVPKQSSLAFAGRA
jgi:hypothetical protein